MIAVIARVKWARVKVAGEVVGQIGPGLLTLLGAEQGDLETTTNQLIEKIVNLRIFEDDSGKMNRSLKDVSGQHLIVSQFTLAADCSTGRRPSFGNALSADKAKQLYELALAHSADLGIHTESGRFQAEMEVESLNHGPATFILETGP